MLEVIYRRLDIALAAIYELTVIKRKRALTGREQYNYDMIIKKRDELTISSHIKNFISKSDISAIFFYAPDPMAGYSEGGGYKPGYRRQRD